MYRKIEDFVSDWKSEEFFTLKIFSGITDDAKTHKAGDNIRTLERIAWHITQTLTEMPFRAGIIDTDYLENKPIPESFEKIIDCSNNRIVFHSKKFVQLLKPVKY